MSVLRVVCVLGWPGAMEAMEPEVNLNGTWAAEGLSLWFKLSERKPAWGFTVPVICLCPAPPTAQKPLLLLKSVRPASQKSHFMCFKVIADTEGCQTLELVFERRRRILIEWQFSRLLWLIKYHRWRKNSIFFYEWVWLSLGSVTVSGNSIWGGKRLGTIVLRGGSPCVGLRGGLMPLWTVTSVPVPRQSLRGLLYN